jgi:hypothetical protein
VLSRCNREHSIAIRRIPWLRQIQDGRGAGSPAPAEDWLRGMASPVAGRSGSVRRRRNESGEPSVFLGRPLVFSGRPLVFSGRPLVFLGRGSVFFGRGLVFLGRPSVFFGRPLVFLGRGSVFFGRGLVFFGRPSVFLGRGVSPRGRLNFTSRRKPHAPLTSRACPGTERPPEDPGPPGGCCP